MGCRIIVIDDEQDFLDSLRRGLITAGYKQVRLERDPRKAAAVFESGEIFDVALIDINMPYMSGIELLEFIKSVSPNTECIMTTAVDEVATAVECLKKGAYDYCVKPISRQDLIHRLRRAEERKRLLDILALKSDGTPAELSNKKAFGRIVSRSPKVLATLKEAELHAASDVPVLISGESGTGKDLLAKAIHMASPRADLPFIAVNMASVAASLFDAEFFGHAKGAFTGAEKERSGFVEQAKRGTLFLDEIGALPYDLQSKLLRVLQEGEYVKLGTARPQKTEARFIAATNEDMKALLARGAFRKDLYYRLQGASVHLPPLRERREDIPLLINTFLAELADGSKQVRIAENAVLTLSEYDYPGNIRELRHILMAAANLATEGLIATHHLPTQLRKVKRGPSRPPHVEFEKAVSIAEIEKAHILKTYAQTSENKSQTARLLGIGINTLRRKLAAYGIK